VATNKLLFVHVGDTRLYRLRNQQLDKLTHDHSLVGLREDANQLTEREAMRHPRRNEILRNVGSEAHRVDDPDFLESGETDFVPGDLLLLCSDGLTDMLTRAEITDILNQTIGAEEQIAELIRQANDQGGQDNITVVLAQHPAPGLVADDVPQERVRTRDRPAILPGNVPGSTRAPAPQRTWKPWLLVLGVLVVLGLVQVKRMIDPLEPASPAQTAPSDSIATPPSGLSIVRQDSSGINNATTQPDSIRVKR
ncbi:MAG: serine/threonine-protein phosphatase, partial [Cytophagaceae bacterium]